ncbi:hypothetical protein CK203_018029 [Vitis vinifera]|uniref:SHSP domain-containing protein n=1 Tax=Vitis vinifera TaxID=29760 RepID=A0A438JW77_VITVI|nr:hypothetical protein CK203_018029 [Vitis vinifera]
MEIELGLRVSRPSHDAISASLRITKDGPNPLFLYMETDEMFILTANLKGYPREKLKISIDEGGTQIAISGEKVITQMMTVGWIAHKREVEVRRFRKVFRIPDGVVLDGINASFNEEESVLKILMPKSVKGISGVKMEEVKEEDIDGRSYERTRVVADEVPETENPRETLKEEINNVTATDEVEGRLSQAADTEEEPTQLNEGEVPSSQETPAKARKDSDSEAKSRAAEEKSKECEQSPEATESTKVEQDQVTEGAQPNAEIQEAAQDQTESLKSDHPEEVEGMGNEIPAETDRVDPPEEKVDDRQGSLAPSKKSKLCSPCFFAGSAIVVSIMEKMRNQGFESWTFRSCLGYQHFVINDKNHDQRKKDSKKTSTATVAEIKTEANVAEKASALVAATDHGDHMTFDSRQVSPLRPSSQKIVPQPMDIQTRQTIGCGIKRGKLYYLDLQSKDSNKLQQALMVDGSEEEKKKSEIWLWHRRLGHASFVIETQYNAKVRVLRSDNGGEYQSSDLQKYLEGYDTIHQTTCFNTPQQNGVGEYHKEIQTLDYDYHISEENESEQSELVNQEAGELDMSDQQFGSEDVFIEIPNQLSFVEGVLNLEPDPFMKQLPHRHNRGIPKPTYELELSTKVKYPMSNYVSNHRLSESNKSFVNQLSTVAIPNSVQEALADPRWKAAMNEEMKSL